MMFWACCLSIGVVAAGPAGASTTNAAADRALTGTPSRASTATNRTGEAQNKAKAAMAEIDRRIEKSKQPPGEKPPPAAQGEEPVPAVPDAKPAAPVPAPKTAPAEPPPEPKQNLSTARTQRKPPAVDLPADVHPAGKNPAEPPTAVLHRRAPPAEPPAAQQRRAPRLDAGSAHFVVKTPKVTPGGLINVELRGFSSDNKLAWVAFYKEGAPLDEHINFTYVRNLPGGVYEVDAPRELGKYLVRLFPGTELRPGARSGTIEVVPFGQD